MTDRGIIFSAPMVRALLDGRKTQTRRLIQPISGEVRPGDIIVSWPADAGTRTGLTFRPPHRAGDRLYVRESLGWNRDGDNRFFYRADDADVPVAQIPSGYSIHNTHAPAIHMPRWASRLTLLVTDVRVQRLQEISVSDAIAEGVDTAEHIMAAVNQLDNPMPPNPVVGAYAALWNSLHNDPGTRWEDNPWIYAVSFDVRRGNIDAGAA